MFYKAFYATGPIQEGMVAAAAATCNKSSFQDDDFL